RQPRRPGPAAGNRGDGGVGAQPRRRSRRHRSRRPALQGRPRPRFDRHPRGGPGGLAPLRLQAARGRPRQPAHLPVAPQPCGPRRGAENEVTPGRRKRPATALAVALSIAGAVLAHFAIVDRFSPALGALLSLVPAAAFLLWLARRSHHRWLIALVLAA